MSARPTDDTTTTARRKRVLEAERSSLRRRLDHATAARDAAEARILALAGDLERLDREIDGQAGR